MSNNEQWWQDRYTRIRSRKISTHAPPKLGIVKILIQERKKNKFVFDSALFWILFFIVYIYTVVNITTVR